ncbi:MAG: GntR family transcriptional regulator [Candidatus Rokubacteria bacterium]|nr:GntR family transcriptional regulator [Candidatus Rokubacteria bacterium]
MSYSIEEREFTQPIQLSTLGQRAFDVLHEAIRLGQLPAGVRLNDVALARKLGVSRSPVREALKRLEYAGLVTVRPHRGTFVVNLTKKQVVDILDVKEYLEALAVRLAAANLSPEQINELRKAFEDLEAKGAGLAVDDYLLTEPFDFHVYVVEVSGNDRLISFMQTIHGQSRLIRLRLGLSKDRALVALEEHRAIFEAMAAGDADLAEERMRAHIRNARHYALPMFPE